MMRAYRSVDLTEDGPRLVTRTVDAARRLEQRLVLRPLKVGVCRSDIKEVAGTRAMRRDFGHEVVAVVDELSATDVLPPGAIVGFDPHVPISRTSGFAEYMIASANRASLQSALVLQQPGTAVFWHRRFVQTSTVQTLLSLHWPLLLQQFGSCVCEHMLPTQVSVVQTSPSSQSTTALQQF